MTRDPHRLASARDHFHELLCGAHGTATVEAIVGLHHENRLATPFMVERRSYESWLAIAKRVTDGLARATEQLLADEPLRRRIGLGRHLDPILDFDRRHGGWPLAARLDAFVGLDGVPRFIEYNAESSVHAHATEINETFAKLPIATAFAERFEFRTIDLHVPSRASIEGELERRGISDRSPVFAVLGDVPLDDDKRWIPHVAARQGWRVLRVGAADLAYRAGRLTAHDETIDVVVLEDWQNIATKPDTLRPVLDALGDGTVSLPYGGRGFLAGYKSVFELLSSPEYAHLFDADTNRVLQSHIPWTRVLRARTTSFDGADIDLLPFITEHRERFVIKPSGVSAGAGVVLGWECTDAQWQAAIKVSRAVQSVVQERVDTGPAETYYEVGPDNRTLVAATCHSDLDPCVWGGARVEGTLARVASKGRHNYAVGASIAPIWILEDER